MLFFQMMSQFVIFTKLEKSKALSRSQPYSQPTFSSSRKYQPIKQMIYWTLTFTSMENLASV